MNLTGLLADWWHIISAAGTGLLGLTTYGKRRLDSVDDRSKQNKRQLQGDPDDPNSNGVLQIAKHNGEKIDHLEDKMDTHHDEVLTRVEQLAEERRDHD